MRNRSTPVPHHRVDLKLYEKAGRKATREGTSLSQVASAGLERLAKSVDRKLTMEYLAADSDGVLRSSRAVQELPADTASTLAEMRGSRDPRLSPYLLALHQAGWSLAALSSPLGISRQAVHDRVSHCDDPGDLALLPAVPEPEWLTAIPSKVAGELKDWPIWVDRDLYAVVAQYARKQGTPMRVLMEGILRDYLAGKVVVEVE